MRIMRTATMLAVVLSTGGLFVRDPAFSQAKVDKPAAAEPARTEELREQVMKMPLQSLVQVKQSDGGTYRARLVELSDQGVALQIMHDRGVDGRQIPLHQLKSIRVDSGSKDLSQLGAMKGLFQVPHGSLVELRLENGERIKGVVQEFLENSFVFRMRNKNLSFETRTIYFAQVISFMIKAVANLGGLSAPEAFELISSSANTSSLQGEKSGSALLPDGTPVVVRLRQTLSTVDARVGDIIDLDVVEEVKAGERVVIPKNGAAWGKVAEVVPKRRMGRGARIGIEISGARTVAGGTLLLKATREAAGGSRTSDMVGAMVGVGILNAALPGISAPFLLVHGAETAIPKGTLMVAYVNGDTQIP